MKYDASKFRELADKAFSFDAGCMRDRARIIQSYLDLAYALRSAVDEAEHLRALVPPSAIEEETEDELNELLLEVGVEYIGKSKDHLLRFRAIHPENITPKVINEMAETIVDMLALSHSPGIQELYQSTKGIIIE